MSARHRVEYSRINIVRISEVNDTPPSPPPSLLFLFARQPASLSLFCFVSLPQPLPLQISAKFARRGENKKVRYASNAPSRAHFYCST